MNPESSVTLAQMEQVNRMILALHDESQPFNSRITGFFQSLQTLVYFDKASLMFFYIDENGEYRKHSSVTLNWNNALLDAYDNGLYRYDDTLKPVDQPYHVLMRSSKYFSSDHGTQSEFWKEYQTPNNASYEVFGNVLIPGNSLKCKICFARSEELEDFTIADVRLIRLFQPHLSEATVKELNAAAPKQTESHPSSDCLCMGSCTVDKDLQITQKSGVFNTLDLLSNGRLSDKALELCREIKAGVKGEAPSVLMTEHKLKQQPIYLEIHADNDEEQNSVFQVFAYDLSRFFNGTLQRARAVYRLTDREFEVLDYMLKGFRYEDIAGSMYISVPSVKKNVASIYEKMGIDSQKQIISKLYIY